MESPRSGNERFLLSSFFPLEIHSPQHRALINEDAQTSHGHHDVQKPEVRLPHSSLLSSFSLSSQEESEHEGHSHGVIFGDPNRTIGAYILEGALAAHSVIIGLSLGTASTADLYALLPALSFHQFFEGLAMGSRVVEAEVPMLTEVRLSLSVCFNTSALLTNPPLRCSSAQSLLTNLQAILVVVYSFSAPIGIAIGVGTFSTFDGDAVTARLVQVPSILLIPPFMASFTPRASPRRSVPASSSTWAWARCWAWTSRAT